MGLEVPKEVPCVKAQLVMLKNQPIAREVMRYKYNIVTAGPRPVVGGSKTSRCDEHAVDPLDAVDAVHHR